MMGPYGSFGEGMGWGGWVAMSLAFIVFWGLVATAVVLVIRSLHQHRASALEPVGSSNALRVLDERFARGEIDADEYNHRRQVLNAR